ncbi:YihY family inner membrane protein [Thalassolituus sp. LLYu03]|uniref:YihY family inner membrane protein n=1 Tax=Thalassolituus sp. LLYu03 TaxID=3421656 RepID=UPI003D27C520
MNFRTTSTKRPSTWPGLRTTGRIIWHTLRRFKNEERQRDAAAMTYTTLFALVPVITVTYAILSAIPSLQHWGGEVHNEMLAYLMPEGSDTVSEYLVQFSQQARKLTWVGVLFLFITAFMLLRSIEMQFNKIWNVEKPRSGLQTFLRYWAVLSLGPLLFGATLAVSSLIASLSLWSNFASVPLPVRVVPWLLSTGALTAIYILVPNCRVPWRHALVAGFFVATVFELGKFAFARLVGLFPSYQLIYGAFAAVPLFLLWLHLAWLLVLLGAELSFSLSHSKARLKKSPLLWARLRVISALWARQQQGLATDEEELAAAIADIAAEDINVQLSICQRNGWVTLSQEGNWVWLKDPKALTMGSLIADMSLKDLTQALPEAAAGAGLKQCLQNWQSNWSSALDTPLSAMLTAD